MLNTKKTAACLTASVLSVLSIASTSAAIIYDNTETSLGQRTDEGNAEIGDVVTFAGTDRLLTSFQFEYFLGTGNGSTAGNETARVFLRAMDGPGGFLPGTVLYDSGSFNITSGYHTVNIENLAITVPNSVAWTVSFGGLERTDDATTGEDAGLLFYRAFDPANQIGTNPTFLDPVTGQQEHYTIRLAQDGTWDLLNHPGVVDNLNARFTAVPEPTTWALMLGGLATFAFLRRRKA